MDWKPRNSVGWGEGIVPPAGHAASDVGGEQADEYYAATPYLPDPESRSGWTLHHVERRRPRPERPPMGFLAPWRDR